MSKKREKNKQNRTKTKFIEKTFVAAHQRIYARQKPIEIVEDDDDETNNENE